MSPAARPAGAARRFPPAERFLPARRSLPALRRAVDRCRACPLFRDATQGVFGEGPVPARLMMVGEQPGDREDLAGRPFVGGAGAMLDRMLAEAGLARDEIFLTNAVKHFKFERRGKRRIHEKPSVGEVQACFPWLAVELELVRPELVVCLGATATRALLGREARVERDHGKVLPGERGISVMPTYHPSALLRAPERVRERARAAFLEDLRLVAARLRRLH